MSRRSQKSESRQARNLPQRSSQHRPVKIKVLIVGEGQETEPNYFRGLRDEPEIKARFAITVKGGHGSTQDRVVKETIQHKKRAENRKEAYDRVFCVVDCEEAANRPMIETACALARANKIEMILSNPSFEVWLLAHFERKGQPFAHAKAAEDHLNTHWRNRFDQDYDKTDRLLYDRLKPHTQDGINNAEWVLETRHQQKPCLESNSSTEVYRLVKLLRP